MHFQKSITSVLVFTLLLVTSALSAAPLMSVEMLKDKIDQANLVIVELQPAAYYQQIHIPGSVNTNYAAWRLTDEHGLGKMLPAKPKLEALIGGLGIDAQSEVVIVPIGQGAGDMAAASRVYWTLYVAGLDELSILDGGLLAYYKTHGEDAMERGAGTAIEPKQFTAALRRHDIMDIEKVANALDQGQTIVDSRSVEEYTGKIAGAPTERPGALPSAINLPYDSLMNETSGRLLDPTQLEARFSQAGIPLSGEQVSYCHTGHRTSLLWFVAHEILGNKDARLYDGSTLEWSSTPDRPLELH